jgi:hypothetical protein
MKPRVRDASTELFKSWTEYAKGAGAEPGTQISLGERLRNAGFEPYKSRTERGWTGICLRQLAARNVVKDD